MSTPLLVSAGIVTASALAGAAWATRLRSVRRAVARYAAHWQSPPAKPDGAIELVALGDSAAQAVGASAPERGWVGQLADHVQRVSGRPVHVVNLSRSGARIADVVHRQLPLLAGLRPDLVVVGVGGNDIVGSFDRERLAAQVEALVAGLPANSIVADVPYFMHGRWQRRALETTRMIHAAARSRGLVVASVHSAMRSQHPWRSVVHHYSADLFHPNDRGYRVWAEAFIRAISSSPSLSSRLAGSGSAG